MISSLTPLKPEDAARRLADGHAVLIDIREADEFVRRHARGALWRPLSTLDDKGLDIPVGQAPIFTCRSGMRTGAQGQRLALACGAEAYVLEGGLDAWEAAGLPVELDRKAPLELMRQVQIVAGLLVLVGAVLGVWVSPWFIAIAAFVGAGLAVAGATGFCGMARLLALAPWNRRASA